MRPIIITITISDPETLKRIGHLHTDFLAKDFCCDPESFKLARGYAYRGDGNAVTVDNPNYDPMNPFKQSP